MDPVASSAALALKWPGLLVSHPGPKANDPGLQAAQALHPAQPVPCAASHAAAVTPGVLVLLGLLIKVIPGRVASSTHSRPGSLRHRVPAEQARFRLVPTI